MSIHTPPAWTCCLAIKYIRIVKVQAAIGFVRICIDRYRYGLLSPSRMSLHVTDLDLRLLLFLPHRTRSVIYHFSNKFRQRSFVMRVLCPWLRWILQLQHHHRGQFGALIQYGLASCSNPVMVRVISKQFLIPHLYWQPIPYSIHTSCKRSIQTWI